MGTFGSENRFSFKEKCLLFFLSPVRPLTRMLCDDGLRPFEKLAKICKYEKGLFWHSVESTGCYVTEILYLNTPLLSNSVLITTVQT